MSVTISAAELNSSPCFSSATNAIPTKGRSERWSQSSLWRGRPARSPENGRGPRGAGSQPGAGPAKVIH